MIKLYLWRIKKDKRSWFWEMVGKQPIL